MKAGLAALALILACGPLQAQTEPKKDQKAIKKADTARPAEAEPRSHSGQRPQRERPAQERETSEGTVKLDRARPQETQRPSSPPSPAQQMQEQQYEQRQRQSQPSNAQRVVQCNARPVCGGGYGRCAAVAQTYQGGTLQAGRRAIVEDCIQANTPDSCACAGQCSRWRAAAFFESPGRIMKRGCPNPL